MCWKNTKNPFLTLDHNLGTPLKTQNFENRASSCFKLAQIRPRTKMSWAWDFWWLRKTRTNKQTNKQTDTQDSCFISIDIIYISILMFVCLSVCLFVCLFFRTNEMQAILLYFGTNEKLELEGILFMSGYPQIFRISQKIRISQKNFYTPRFFFDFFIFFWKCGFFQKKIFSISGIFLKMWIFPKKIFLKFFSISDFFSKFWIFLKKLYTPIFFEFLGNFPYRYGSSAERHYSSR